MRKHIARFYSKVLQDIMGYGRSARRRAGRIMTAAEVAMSQVDVLVVGAGPVGLTVAAELARRGVHSRIIDQSQGPSATSKAIAIQPRTLEIFKHMGVVDEVLARGFAVDAGNFYWNSRPLGRVDFQQIDSPYRFILDLPQNETEEVLLEHLARTGLIVERDTRLLNFDQDAEGITVQVAQPAGTETIRSAYVIGCDGAYSTVRHNLGLESSTSPEHEVLILGDVDIDWVYPHELHMFMHNDGFLVCFPLPAGRYRLIAEVTAQERPSLQNGNERPPKATLERFREIVRQRADPSANVTEVTWLAGFRVRHQVVQNYGKGRAFVAGDAAHVPSPAGGQGMNTGIQDACNLAWKIQLALHGQASDRLLDSYSAERAPVGREMVALSDRMGHKPVSDVAALVDQISEIGIHYHESPIVAQDWTEDAGPAPGDRAPLVDGLDGSGHHLLMFTANDADLPALRRVSELMPKSLVYPTLVSTTAVEWDAPVIIDANRKIHQSYGAKTSCVYLIRPDGYVGYRACPPDPERMSDYLKMVFR